MRRHWITKPFKLFSGAPQFESFRRMPSTFPVRVLRRAESPSGFAEGPPLELPKLHAFAGRKHDSADFLATTDTVGLIVLHDGRRVYEGYWHGGEATLQWPAWSVTKSFISALIGVAVHEGAIRSIDDQVNEYVPQLQGSAYDGASIRAVLQMSSGARWDENYANPESDLRRRADAMAGGSYDEVAKSCMREHTPGTNLRYNTNDTHVLGMVLRCALKQNLTSLMRERLWDPLSMQHDAFWRVDGEGIEDAGAGLHVTLGDMCKLGQLYLDQGTWNGREVVPESWVRASTRPDGAHVTPGVLPGSHFGYGYQWWLPGTEREYAAIGVYTVRIRE